MNTQIVVRRLRRESLSQVVSLLNTLVPWEVSMEKAMDAFEAMDKDPDTAVLVAMAGDKVLGTVTVVCSQVLAAKFAAIEDVVVADAFTGQGIGTMLMQAADNFALQRGCGYVTVVSSGHRKQAHRFYEKCGFVEDVRGFRKDCGSPANKIMIT